MRKTEAKKRIEKLKAVISHHRYLYHVLNTQEISDAALDSLKHELYQLEQRHPEFITLDSPTQRVGGEPLKEFKKVSHKIPMLSIEDIFSEKELEDWEKYLRRLAPRYFSQKSGGGYFCELKIDGFAVTLIYKNGIFVRGATRGNGRIGEDVTQNLKTIESIPLRLKIKKEIEIRGEVYMEKQDFDKLNKQLEKRGEKIFANPRNLAAGSIRQLNPKILTSRPLKFLAYDIVTNLGIEKHSQEHQLLKQLGFKTDPISKERKNLKQVIEYWREIAKKRETLPFQIDGVVVSVNNNSLFQKLGSVGKSPRAVRAFKFSPKQATTKIKNIKIQIGRTGAVTPVAVLEPVKICGATISRATLHNEDELRRLGARIGDTVIIERAGDVIPAVAKVLPELRSGREKIFQMPKFCVVCDVKLIKPAQEKVWRCPNKNCPARRLEFLEYFVSKKAFDIKGLGPKIINQLMDENLISRVSDIFELKQGDLLPIERFAKKSSENLIKAIEKSKKIDLHRFIYALGIRHVGEETSIVLANHFSCLTELSNAKIEEIKQLPDIGFKVSQSIYKWFYQKTNQKFLKDLMKAGVEIKVQGSKDSKVQKFKNTKFVFTGELNTMSRNEAKEKIRLFGGRVSDLVSKNTDYLIVGKNPGAKKLGKAKQVGVKIISEKEFLQLLSVR